jgi:hypothetical protein
MLRRAAAITARERIRGLEPREWRWNGYKGICIPECAYGVRHDGGIVRLSGALAHRWWDQIIRRAERVTRLDVEVTVGGIAPGLNLAADARAAADAYKPLTGRPAEWTYIVTKQRGATCYVGSRASARYCRLYDKGAEEGGPHLSGKWRYEVEVKDEVARALGPALEQSTAPALACISIVHDHFCQRGVQPAFAPAGAVPQYIPAQVPTDVERTLEWFRKWVAPSVSRLRLKGYEGAVLEALGLADVAGPPATSGTGDDGHWQPISPAAPYWTASSVAGGK